MTTGFALERASEHRYEGHPEHPSRLGELTPVLESISAQEIAARPATWQEIGRIHTADMLRGIEEACRREHAILDMAPTYVTRGSLDCALRAAGATIQCVLHVLDGDAGNAFSIVRPPGHHAEPDRAMGFCLLNNVAIAAAAALDRGVPRIAIVDFDAHHGNGTQAAFLEDPRVAFLSTHQWGIYPGTGWYEDLPGSRSRLVNVPLPARSGDRTYGRIAEEIIAPFLRRFRPELLLVSTGFDAHWDDPITSLGLSYGGFYGLSRNLVELADELCHGKIVFVLEGGYQPANVAHGCQAVLAALTGKGFDAAGDASPYEEPDADQRLAAVRALHAFGD